MRNIRTVLGVFDTETSAELTEEECMALIKVMELGGTNSWIWRCSRFTSVAVMTA